jgi:dipeptidyl aminopeptidase/acylaminoacyl peptidase
VRSEDIALLNSASAPTVHPDGGRAAVSATHPDFASDSYVGQLWEVPLDDGGGAPRRLTRGFRDTAPAYSPDGHCLAFLRAAGPGERAQLMVVGSRGGEPVAVTDEKLGVSSFVWSPDSRRLVFVARVPADGRYGTMDGVGPGAEDARLVTGYKYRLNGIGYTGDKRAQLFAVDAPDVQAEPPVAPVGRAARRADRDGDAAFSPVPEARRLTFADADHDSPAFSPDGRTLYFTAALHEGADEDLRRDVYALEPDDAGGSPRLMSNLSGPLLAAASPRPSADGNWLFYLGSLIGGGRDFVAQNAVLYAAPVSAPHDVRRLTDPEGTDLVEGTLVAAGPDAVLALNRHRGAVQLVEVPATGGIAVLVDGPLTAAAADRAAGRTVVSYSDASTAGDLGLVTGNGLTRLTDFSAALRDSGIIAPREETFASADGYPVHGWVLLPEGRGPHPVLLNIHGGPFAQYGWEVFDEAQVYARAGYAVVMCNPRGSAGYGQAHGRAVKGDMGALAMADVLAFLEGSVAKYPQLDGTRQGIMGGSYGGYLTAWTVSRDHRFTAAIVERGYLDPPSFVGSSDIGWFFSDEYTGTDPEQVRSQNPFAGLDSVRTPVFVIHSEDDLRCPLEQAQRYYVGLKQRGVPTQLLIFPGENHELSRTGTPWHRKQRFDEILRWWAAHLPTAQNNDGGGTAAEPGPAAQA